MNVPHPKLHTVLTAKAKHAEFKCPLCKKLFVSGYHLNRHKLRRHSHHSENVKEQEQVVQYRNALEERIRNRQAVNASLRMEKLLRNMRLDETYLFDRSKQFNSTSYTDLSYSVDHFPYLSVLSPITSDTNIIENVDVKRVKAIGLASDIKCKENIDSKFMNHIHKSVTSRELDSGDTKEVYLFYEKACQTAVNSKENILLNGSESDLKLTSNLLVKETQTDEGDIEHISSLKNVSSGNEKGVNKPTSLSEFILNNNMRNIKSKVIIKDMSTQTDEVIYGKNCTYTQTCRSFNVCDEYYGSTLNTKENIIGCREPDIDLNESHPFEESNTKNVSCLENSVVSVDENYSTFEREFQESFEARKNLLEKDDFLFYNSNVDNTSVTKTQCEDESIHEIEQVSVNHSSINAKLESDIQESFEARRNLLSRDHLKVFSDYSENGTDLKCHNESIEKIENPTTKISVVNEPNFSDATYPDINNSLEDLSSFSGKRREDILQNIKGKLSARLRSLGVDPKWSGISDVVAKKTNAILTVRRINISKKIPRYMSLRTLLNNTIDQILEDKECE